MSAPSEELTRSVAGQLVGRILDHTVEIAEEEKKIVAHCIDSNRFASEIVVSAAAAPILAARTEYFATYKKEYVARGYKWTLEPTLPVQQFAMIISPNGAGLRGMVQKANTKEELEELVIDYAEEVLKEFKKDEQKEPKSALPAKPAIVRDARGTILGAEVPLYFIPLAWLQDKSKWFLQGRPFELRFFKVDWQVKGYPFARPILDHQDFGYERTTQRMKKIIEVYKEGSVQDVKALEKTKEVRAKPQRARPPKQNRREKEGEWQTIGRGNKKDNNKQSANGEVESVNENNNEEQNNNERGVCLDANYDGR